MVLNLPNTQRAVVLKSFTSNAQVDNVFIKMVEEKIHARESIICWKHNAQDMMRKIARIDYLKTVRWSTKTREERDEDANDRIYLAGHARN